VDLETASRDDGHEIIEAFFDEAKEAQDGCYREAGVYGVPLPARLMAIMFGAILQETIKGLIPRWCLNFPRRGIEAVGPTA
jgi:hypothetical protein